MSNELSKIVCLEHKILLQPLLFTTYVLIANTGLTGSVPKRLDSLDGLVNIDTLLGEVR